MTLPNKFQTDRNFFIGLLLMIPATLFWFSVVLEQGFHSPAFLENVFLPMDNSSPIFPITRMLILPFVAFIINFFSIVNINAHKEGKEIKGNFSIEAKLLNILLVVYTCVSVAVVLGYLLTENYNHP